jgi:hypothetical protein
MEALSRFFKKLYNADILKDMSSGVHLRCLPSPFSIGSFLPSQGVGQTGGRCD